MSSFRGALTNALSLSVAALTLATVQAHAAAKVTVLTRFPGTVDLGVRPFASLIADAAGNLYGTTYFGGASGVGNVFKLSPPAAGTTTWTGSVLTEFNGTNGAYPLGSLIADAAGNLYGTTSEGGASNDGTVFELSPPAAGTTVWTETVLIAFNGINGADPLGSLIADAAGNLYGTTAYGGASNDGTVFELSPPAAGTTAWTETVLTAFTGTTGAGPSGSLITDAAGNFYGTTAVGGAVGYGTVFELLHPAAGTTAWTQTVLASFDETNGGAPVSSLIADAKGNLYGTTLYGGALDEGTVFRLSPPAAGTTAWTETVLTAFNVTDGEGPMGSLIADAAGNLYGTTSFGGAFNNRGTVFKLSPPAPGTTIWTETVLIAFDGHDGWEPLGSLIADANGNLYGTTLRCTSHCGGTVFKLSSTGFVVHKK